ncbi:hypothetical protein OEZ85_007418 [Tetradesmus obliquus]|uniref:Hydroxymethylglutaryl-CoA synthase n=1 Tax=Tetradesmus obliquus TaxID=3088 RepID=A0ABY8TI00_TETOB|nr:hypothetical protein OEZ85_007418 [Tetradesmus obliquus]
MESLPSRQNVGVRGLYVYFPRLVVQQVDLEQADSCSGKYTVGLGQEAMTFCGDREDVVSMAATAVLRLLEAAGVALTAIGKIEVGTETGVDRSKSVMSYLVQHFQQQGNTTLQGSDHMHGCYGGTAALLSVADWVGSPSWDGRLGLAVATDIAVYPEGSPARPTGGSGAAALLIGPDAPLVLEQLPWRSHFAAHTFDFFKPHGHPLYPVVDGPATTLWFTKAADACAAHLYQQLKPLLQQQQQQQHACQCQQQQQCEQQQLPGLLSCFDHFLSHAPYNKIVRKVFARLVLQDMLRAHQQQLPEVAQTAVNSSSGSSSSSVIRQRLQLPPLPPEAAALDPACLSEASILDRQLEKALLAASSALYEQMAAQGAALQRQLGNLYTASLFSGLAGLLAQQGPCLAGKRLLCFSYGSGVVASMFCLRGRDVPQQQQQCDLQEQQQPLQRGWQRQDCSLQRMADMLALPQRLQQRLHRSVAAFDAAMASLRAAYGAAPYVPGFGPLEELEEGVVYLERIDEQFRRYYARRQ